MLKSAMTMSHSLSAVVIMVINATSSATVRKTGISQKTTSMMLALSLDCMRIEHSRIHLAGFFLSATKRMVNIMLGAAWCDGIAATFWSRNISGWCID